MQFSSHKSPVFLLSLIYSKTHLVSMTLYSNFPPAVSPVVNFLINSYLEGWPFASYYIFHAPMNNKFIQCVLTVGLYMHLCWAFQELCLWRISPYPEKKAHCSAGLGKHFPFWYSMNYSCSIIWQNGKGYMQFIGISHYLHLKVTKSLNHRTAVVGKDLWRLSSPIKSWQPAAIYNQVNLIKMS